MASNGGDDDPFNPQRSGQGSHRPLIASIVLACAILVPLLIYAWRRAPPAEPARASTVGAVPEFASMTQVAQSGAPTAPSSVSNTPAEPLSQAPTLLSTAPLTRPSVAHALPSQQKDGGALLDSSSRCQLTITAVPNKVNTWKYACSCDPRVSGKFVSDAPVGSDTLMIAARSSMQSNNGSCP